MQPCFITETLLVYRFTKRCRVGNAAGWGTRIGSCEHADMARGAHARPRPEVVGVQMEEQNELLRERVVQDLRTPSRSQIKTKSGYLLFCEHDAVYTLCKLRKWWVSMWVSTVGSSKQPTLLDQLSFPGDRRWHVNASACHGHDRAC